MFKNINFGIKISLENFNLLPCIYENCKLIDFIEVSLPSSFTNEDLNKINNLKIPCAIHLPTSKVGFDIGEIRCQQKNKEIIDKINQYKDKFDELKPICYIIHPESGDYNLSITNLKNLKIKPIALENMPLKGIYGYDLMGYDPYSLRKFYEEIPALEFCFDINHAIKAAISLNKDYLRFINTFLKFKKPIIFHISGGNLNIEIDEHLALNEGQYNLFEIRRILLSFKSVVNLTLETPRNNKNSINDDLKNLKIFLMAKNNVPNLTYNLEQVKVIPAEKNNEMHRRGVWKAYNENLNINLFTRNPISYEDHCKWWDNAFDNEFIYIILYQSSVCGYIRLTKTITSSREKNVISISLIKKYQHGGIGTYAYKIFEKKMKDKGINQIIALTILSNKVGKKFFEKLDFKSTRIDKVDKFIRYVKKL